MLQYFNTSWREISEKMPEIAEAGYESLWVPPPTKAGGGFSVGYDLFDRFDLGSRDQKGTVATRYGTEQELLDLIRAATAMFDSGQTWSASLIHLGNVLKLDLGAKSQSVQGLTFSQNIKICGVGLSMKIGRRAGHNNSNYPKSLSVTASSLLAGYDVQTEVKNWFEAIFPP